MQNFIFITPRELSVFGIFFKHVHKKDPFFLFMYIKKFRKKKRFLRINKNYNDCNWQKTSCIFLYIQKAKKCKTCLYTKILTLFKTLDNLRYVFIYKKQDTWRYTIFHEISEVGVYIQKSWHFALRDVFI